MTCYTGFGNLASGRRFFSGDFNADGKSELLFYFPTDGNWWLGTFSGNTLTWTFAGNTSGFGNLNDGRPIWVADFAGAGRADVVFYSPGDRNWWIGQFNAGGQMQWNLAGNTAGFGQVADGRPFFAGDFTGDGKSDLLFYTPNDHNWWLGAFIGAQLVWRSVGNTRGFGNLADRRPIWSADFTGTGTADILFYSPGDKNWWLAQFVNGQMQWTFVGNTIGFGQVWDGRPFYTGDFTGDGKADVVFHSPGDRNWWRGAMVGNALTWTFAGNTTGFGNVVDGRPIWAADFAGVGRSDLLFYSPRDRNWWLGQVTNAGQLSWTLAGNTSGFGQIWDGRPFYVADFNGGGKFDVLFYFPGDGNWQIGSFAGTALQWNFAGNTGRPGRERLTVHYKSLLPLTDALRNYLSDQHAAMEELFAQGSNIAVMRGTTEDLSGMANAAQLADLDVAQCIMGTTTAEQNTLYGNRNNVGANDVVVFLANSLIGGAGNFLGCAAFPAGRPSCSIVQSTARWLTAHEVGHVLGLRHVTDTTRLMNPSVGWTNLPPDLVAAEFTTLRDSALTTPC